MNFIHSNDMKVGKKFQYLLQILIDQQVVHSEFVKKLVGTPFYELRIKLNQEFRIILLPMTMKILRKVKVFYC